MSVFISYRRDGAESLAHLLYTRLRDDGYDVFLDVESLRSGKFNTALYEQIDRCTDFLLLLPQNGLDRCSDPEDWVRLETEYAINKDKNIIPVMMRNFEFPKNLPESISQLPYYNAVKAEMDYFDAVMKKLEGMLRSKIVSAGNPDSKYPAVEDPNLTEEDIRLLTDHYFSDIPVKTNEEKERLDEAVKKYTSIRIGETCVVPRKKLHRITYNNIAYDIYDVFFYTDSQKYAYAFPVGKRWDDRIYYWQGTFFKINEDDSFELLFVFLQLIRKEADLFDKRVEFLLWYIKDRRGLGVIPKALYPQLVSSLRSGSFTDKRDAVIADICKSKMASFKRNREDDILSERLMLADTNLLSVFVNGKHRGMEAYIDSGNCYGYSFQGRYLSKPITEPLKNAVLMNTPLKNMVIVDILRLGQDKVNHSKEKNRYIVFCLTKVKRKGYEYLGIKYFRFVYVKDNGKIVIKDYNKYEYLDYSHYNERFALIKMQMKLLLPHLFYYEDLLD